MDASDKSGHPEADAPRCGGLSDRDNSADVNSRVRQKRELSDM